MDEALALGAEAGRLLLERHQTIAIAESSAAGLISAALLAVPGASAYFVGGSVVYTRASRTGLLGIAESSLEGIRASTEAYAMLLARSARERLGTDWAIGETGATGPTGTRYGAAAGHACFAVSGPAEASRTLETASGERITNMYAFAAAALRLFLDTASGVD
jgi:PncC family amidohydrolase